MAISFRAPLEADLDTLVQLRQELYEFDHTPLSPAQLGRTTLEKIMRDDSLGRVWLICVEDEAVGYVVLTLGYSLEYQGRDAFVDEFYLRASHRRQGVGTQALKFVEEVARSLGVHALHLEVERANTPAQAFYRKAGFEDHNRYLMTKWLSKAVLWGGRLRPG